MREDFRKKQEAEERKLREEENKKKFLLDEALAKELLVCRRVESQATNNMGNGKKQKNKDNLSKKKERGS